ncbi:MAG: class I SAM-dependent methyltransferase [Ilumatobacter sp.]|uniref:class I SAM-dependent methyltransferase n=1 Tax=Ilumatobacter sp. TaxID=1967498 RepID=UPI00262F14CC|nr:class I SAM-dependent methyltransferase [Ilumatobacter sp.]MDJ0770676.1 class I SAM-dependent methyltransferase [Ilumatobacter sp.]
MPIAPELRDVALATKGFMPPDEGDALHAAALIAGDAVPGAPWVEVGSYCGRSTIWLGDAARSAGTALFAVDHHRGSEENQAGWEHHDAAVVDERTGKMDTLPFFRRAIHDAGLEGHVVGVVGESPTVARHWATPVAFLFIDGGHGAEPARLDYEGWAPHVAVGGTMAIHDVFPDPADGGRPPYEEIYLPAIESGRFELASVSGSLRVLTRIS